MCFKKKKPITFNEDDFYGYLNAVIVDYENELKRVKQKVSRITCLRAAISGFLPVVIVVCPGNQWAPILMSSIILFLEFVISFNKFPDRIKTLSLALNELNRENSLFLEGVGRYTGEVEKFEKEFKERVIDLIYRADDQEDVYDWEAVTKIQRKVE